MDTYINDFKFSIIEKLELKNKDEIKLNTLNTNICKNFKLLHKNIRSINNNFESLTRYIS